MENGIPGVGMGASRSSHTLYFIHPFHLGIHLYSLSYPFIINQCVHGCSVMSDPL